MFSLNRRVSPGHPVLLWMAALTLALAWCVAQATAGATADATYATGVDQDDEVLNASAYNAVSVAEAGRDVHLAIWRNGQTASALTTAIAVTNLGDGQAEVSLSLTDLMGDAVPICGGDCTEELAAGATHYWWMPEIPGIPTSRSQAVGSAKVSSTQPVVAVVLDLSMADDADGRLDSSAFVGAAADGPTSLVQTVPLALRSGGDDLVADTNASTPLRVSGISGAGETGILVRNLHATMEASVVAQFYPQVGGAPKQIMGNVPPGAGYSFYLPALGIPDGAYAALITADRPIASIVRTDWPARGGAYMNRAVTAGTEVIVPLIMKNHENRCSLITVQNVDEPITTNVDVEFYAAASGSLLFTRTYSIQPGGSITLRLCDEDDFVVNLPEALLGTLIVSSQGGAQQVAVEALVDYIGSDMAVTGFGGVPSAMAKKVLHAPLVHSGWQLPPADPVTRLDSYLAVANMSSELAVVQVSYRGVRGSCEGQEYSHQALTLTGNSMALFDPGSDGLLPAGCVASAVVESTGPVVASVHDEGTLPDLPPGTPQPTDTLTPSTPTSTVTATATGITNTPGTPSPTLPGQPLTPSATPGTVSATPGTPNTTPGTVVPPTSLTPSVPTPETTTPGSPAPYTPTATSETPTVKPEGFVIFMPYLSTP